MNFLEQLEQMSRNNREREAKEAEAWQAKVAEGVRKAEEERRIFEEGRAARQKEHERRFTPVPKHREFALRIREESGVGLLVARLGEILEKDDIGKATLNQQRGDHFMFYTLRTEGIDTDNINSAVDVVTWREPHDISGIVWPNRALAVESHPSGQILFHGMRREDIESKQWKGDRGILVEALGRAFSSPAMRDIDEGLSVAAAERRRSEVGYSPLRTRPGAYRGPRPNG